MIAALAWAALSLVWPDRPVHVHVRWRADIGDAQRVELERRFQLTDPRRIEGSSWEYQLANSATANIRALVQDERVDDTAHLNRIRYRPEFAQDRQRQIVAYAFAIGGIGAVLFIWAAGIPRVASRPALWAAELAAALSRSRTGPSPTVVRPLSARMTAAAILAAAVVAMAMTSFAGASFWSAVAALIVVYVAGYVGGALLVRGREDLSLAVIRTVAGLLLAAVAFLLSLVLSLPWWLLPVALVAATVWLRGRDAFLWPRTVASFQWDGIAAGILVVILLAPIAITFFCMAPGSYPPVFYNIDTAYFLEKVHALVAANTYPPESLSNVGVRRTYHYGTQAMAALISRSSGLLPHHAVFLIVLPLLSAGVVAAAFAVARHVSPAVPRSVAVPLLLLSIPSLSQPFWSEFSARVRTAAASGELSIAAIVGDYALWGFLSNEGQNVGGDFMILGSIAGMAAAGSWGWTLPMFLVGAAILVKTPVGIALFAGFTFRELWSVVVAKRFVPSSQMVVATAMFLTTLLAFFLLSFESEYRVEPSPLNHLFEMHTSGKLPGLFLDMLWLGLTALLVWSVGIRDPEKRSAPILLMAVAPILIVNTTRLENITTGGGGTGGDWVQILHPVPFLLHAFVLSLASRRWLRLGAGRRAAFFLLLAMLIVPVVTAAAHYSLRLLRDPESGTDYVDNRSLAEALAAIPETGTIVVTNDLRYPAGNFARDDRQMQIPALFGHQAFAVNYAHEAVEERRELQQLLQQPEWTEAIMQAARTHSWTHLLIHKNYVHPTPIPLEQTFENEAYAIFRFP